LYRHCIFCSAELGSNDALELFPVGRRVAFDGSRGRLWAVCLRCGRWNLAPLEERWEPVEAAERLFRDARMKVQSERVGLARLPDGTSLVRVGDAVPGEMAAWRYGARLLQRRRRATLISAVTGAAGAAFIGGTWAFGGTMSMLSVAHATWLRRYQKRVLFRVDPADDPTGRGALIRYWHVGMIRLRQDDAGEPGVSVLHAWREKVPWSDVRYPDEATLTLNLGGEPARALLARSMARLNHRGASQAELQQALQLLEQAGDADQVLRNAAARGLALGVQGHRRLERVRGPEALAVEMALNEQSERQALEGELVALERAWKEAEEIAAIADTLPGEETLNRLLARLAARSRTV
jgi:hypothetical protein